MNAKKITEEAISKIKVSALPNIPTNQTSFGGGGYDAMSVKAAFDSLPIYIIEQFNALIDDIHCTTPLNSILGAIPTGISEGHSVAQLIFDLQSGNAAAYIAVGNKSLATELLEIKAAIRKLGGEI